jgi:hypothetical protein
MAASTLRNRSSRRAQRKRTHPTNSLPPIVCARCGGPLVAGAEHRAVVFGERPYMVGESGVVQTRDASRSHSNRRFAGAQ